jgi:hypothetical protein
MRYVLEKANGDLDKSRFSFKFYPPEIFGGLVRQGSLAD